jgi:hypothetical protein
MGYYAILDRTPKGRDEGDAGCPGGALQPAQEDLLCARICDRLLAQTALHVGVGRGLAGTAGCAAEGARAAKRSARRRRVASLDRYG